MIQEPVDVGILLEPCFAHRAPDLDHPAEHPEMVVDPVERTADHLLGGIAKLVIDGDVGIAGQLGSLRADSLVMPEVLGVHLGVGQMIEGPQKDAGPGVKGHPAGDVRMADHEFDYRTHLGLRGWKTARPQLLELLTPIPRKVSIKIKTLLRLFYP